MATNKQAAAYAKRIAELEAENAALRKPCTAGEMTAIEYNTLGDPTNLPDNDPVLLYGMDGLDAEGPILGQWDSTSQVWSDHKYGQIDWRPMFFAVPPENPCKDIAEPTCNNEVV